MRRKPKLDNRIERCGHLLVAEPENLCGRWLDEFPYSELFVELGCGKGLFTVDMAMGNPEILFVGLERISNVLVIALERAERSGLNNIRFLNRLADDLTKIFTAGEVSRIYINFCDPWPANRHKKRRMTGQRFLELYKQVLQPGGEIHFKTDDFPLFEFSQKEFHRCGFILSDNAFDLHEDSNTGVMTDYEIKFRELGMPIYRFVARIDDQAQGTGNKNEGF